MYEWSYEHLVELPDDEHESCNGEHLVENHAGDIHNLDELARKPASWYNNLVEILPLLVLMSSLLSQKRKIAVELEIDAYVDLDVQVLRALDWHKFLMLESDETVTVSVEEGEDEIDELYYSQ